MNEIRRQFLPRRLIPRIDRLKVNELAVKRSCFDMGLQFRVRRISAVPGGAHIVRVHDVAPSVQAARIADELLQISPEGNPD